MIKKMQPEINDAPNNIIHAFQGHNKILKILMLEDDENDARLIQMYLRSSTLSVHYEVVSNKQDYIKALETKEYDVILSDHNIPQFSSLEALRIRNEIKFNIPFILVTGTIPEEYAVTILQQGANDYILKDRPQRLLIAITEAINKQKAITEKKLAEHELIKSNERYELAAKASFDSIWDYDIRNKKVYYNEAFSKMFGIERGSNSAYPIDTKDYVHPEDAAWVDSDFGTFIKSENIIWNQFFRIIKADGSFAFVKQKVIVMRNENNHAYRAIGVIEDITEVKELQNTLMEEKLNHQKQNTEIAIQSQEEERNYIGKELHDNINQLMAFAKMMLDTARNSPNIRDICIDKSYEGINMAMEEVRKLSHALAPPAFSTSIDFIDAVNDLVANIQISGLIDITVNIPTNGQFNLSSEKIKLTFYRIIQEQLNNILKHAKATNGSVSLDVTKNTYRLEITDNGLGFDCNTKRTGIGLRNIESRVEVHSGKMEIISAPGKGCTLKVEIPIK